MINGVAEKQAGLFEVGRAFDREGRPEDPESFETRRLAFAIAGQWRPHWSEPPERRAADFFDAKAIVERVVRPFADPDSLSWSPFEAEAYSPGAAALARTAAGQPVAVVGAVAENERDRRRMPPPVFAGELLLDAIPPAPAATKYRPDSPFPAIEADLSFAQPRELAWAEISRFVEEQRLPHLEIGRAHV